MLSVDASLRLWDLRRLNAPLATQGGGAAAGGMGAVWSREAPSPNEPPQVLGLPPGDPVLSLQLYEDKVLTSHGGKRWTARIWDLV